MHMWLCAMCSLRVAMTTFCLTNHATVRKMISLLARKRLLEASSGEQKPGLRKTKDD